MLQIQWIRTHDTRTFHRTLSFLIDSTHAWWCVVVVPAVSPILGMTSELFKVSVAERQLPAHTVAVSIELVCFRYINSLRMDPVSYEFWFMRINKLLLTPSTADKQIFACRSVWEIRYGISLSIFDSSSFVRCCRESNLQDTRHVEYGTDITKFGSIQQFHIHTNRDKDMECCFTFQKLWPKIPASGTFSWNVFISARTRYMAYGKCAVRIHICYIFGIEKHLLWRCKFHLSISNEIQYVQRMTAATPLPIVRRSPLAQCNNATNLLVCVIAYGIFTCYCCVSFYYNNNFVRLQTWDNWNKPQEYLSSYCLFANHSICKI